LLVVVVAEARAETSMAVAVTKVAAVDATEIAAGTASGIVVIVAAAGGTVVIAVVVAVALDWRDFGEEAARQRLRPQLLRQLLLLRF
jgi:hypothetical protein